MFVKERRGRRGFLMGPRCPQTNATFACKKCEKVYTIDDGSGGSHGINGSEPHFQNPKQIKEYLDQHVIGQEYGKKVLSTAVFNHYCRMQMNKNRGENAAKNDKVCLEKSNVLLLGPSGSGKTLIAKTLAEMLQVPFSMNDATTLTQAGYVGEDVESLIFRLLQAEHGIIFLDEVDKIRKRPSAIRDSRDVGGEGVQQSLLKMLEGTVVTVQDKSKRNGRAEEYQIDTSNILFVLSGAFVGLDKVISQRITSTSIGFAAAKKETVNEKVSEQTHYDFIMSKLETDDLINYGLIPEFVGRIPVVAVLQELRENDLVHALTEPKNSVVKQIKALFKHNGIELVFEKDALVEIARLAIKKKVGARGLRGIVDHILQESMYAAPNSDISRIIVDVPAVKGERPPRYVHSKTKTKSDGHLDLQDEPGITTHPISALSTTLAVAPAPARP
ncbi:ClpX, ATPase regulatory subunit [Rozella allomycis CSF55]|uniref:ATPase, AAA-2 domain-containing protein n=1 Tax=Rozella allomycis (strain CSF55) TaxID=988480 RepID=A0A075AUP2_ROZAC|nr:ATPase, AAA-2 domain-containing protein [Rozella allomycis CSF55]RKP17660.1 ClpX, ATPase regulatory subunit [Rozella allomycis CSF55]|eukprot:EPZ34006.1 ATPase, AAA-2 domain-containing protein [Rozella allomycis CSF55]